MYDKIHYKKKKKNTASLLHSAGMSFLAIVYTKHSLASGPSLCLECSSLDIHRAGSLAFFRLHRCLSLTTVSKREVSSFPTILLSFTLLLSFSSFLSLTYIFFFNIWSLQEDKLLETGTLSWLLTYF